MPQLLIAIMLKLSYLAQAA